MHTVISYIFVKKRVFTRQNVSEVTNIMEKKQPGRELETYN